MLLRVLILVDLLTVSVLCLTADEIEAERSGWSLEPNTQYHIQTDEGPERYFRFQTLNGQYRKEKRLADGTVIGTEGWLDPLGYLRLKDYIADHEGFRILRSKMVYVGKERPIQDAVAEAKKVPAQTGVLAKPRRPPNPFRKPETNDVAPLLGNDINSGFYAATTARPREVPYVPSNNYYYNANRGSAQGLEPYSRRRNQYYPSRQPSQVLRTPIAAYEASSRTNPQISAVSRNGQSEYPPYDGTYTTANGFQYYLKRHYHEEERKPAGDSVGSFGYIDPFGIRRVVYYKTDPQTGGFVHKKNNRYVGFSATPYDPSPPDLSRRRYRSPSTSSVAGKSLTSSISNKSSIKSSTPSASTTS